MTSIQRQGRFWDRVTVRAQPVTEALALIRSVLPLEAIRGREVLDVGCGTGDYSAGFVRAGARDVTGIDVSAGSLRLAQQKTEHGWCIQASLGELPFCSHTFDVIWAWGMLHYVPDVQASLSELCRVLRPDGVAVIHTLRRGFWSAFESTTANALSHAPHWVEPAVIGAGERAVSLVSYVLTGQQPGTQTSKPITQKLHERFFVPGHVHTFTLDQIRAGLPQFIVEEAFPPVSDLLKRNMSLTIVARKVA